MWCNRKKNLNSNLRQHFLPNGIQPSMPISRQNQRRKQQQQQYTNYQTKTKYLQVHGTYKGEWKTYICALVVFITCIRMLLLLLLLLLRIRATCINKRNSLRVFSCKDILCHLRNTHRTGRQRIYTYSNGIFWIRCRVYFVCWTTITEDRAKMCGFSVQPFARYDHYLAHDLIWSFYSFFFFIYWKCFSLFFLVEILPFVFRNLWFHCVRILILK